MKKKRKVRFLKDVHFNFEGAHIALTSQGAASHVDEPYLLKSLLVDGSEEKAASGGEVTEVAKVTESNKPENDKEDLIMSNELIQKLQEEIESLRSERKLDKGVAALSKYNLDPSLVKELVEAVEVETLDVIVQALDAVVEAATVVEEVVEAVESEAVTVEVAEEEEESELDKEEENDLTKTLRKEAGHQQVQPQAGSNSLLARFKNTKSK